MLESELTIITAVNREEVCAQNLLRSPDVIDGTVRVIDERGHSSAGAAYNAGINRCGEAPVVAFVHQDVYLPADWVKRVHTELMRLDADWAVAGVWGIRSDGRFAGQVWCTGGGQEHVGMTDGISEAASVDEIVILINMKHRLRFDPSLPGYHLYATDIIQQAKARGLKSYVIHAPVIHNSRVNPQPLDRHYFAAYRYIQRKWRNALPLKTAVVSVTRSGWPLYKQWAKNEVRKLRRKVIARPPAADPKAIASKLGYEVSPS